MIRPFLWLMDLIINHFFTFVTVVKFFLFSFLEVSPDIFSLSFLAAISGTIARMNLEREYWIFLISGLSSRQIFNCFSIFALLFMALEFLLCFFVSPVAMYERKMLLNQARMDAPIKFFRSNSLIRDFPGLTIYVEKVKNAELFDITISYREGSDLVCKIFAQKAKVFTDKQGYLFLSLEKGFIETYSIKKTDIMLKVKFDFYVFSLHYRTMVNFPPIRKIKEMTLPLLVDSMFSSFEKKEVLLITIKRLIFTILPLFYLFLGFYAGIGIKASGYFQILGTGLLIGLASYFVILFGEALVYKTGNVFIFLVSPLIFILATVFIRRKYLHVT